MATKYDGVLLQSCKHNPFTLIDVHGNAKINFERKEKK